MSKRKLKRRSRKKTISKSNKQKIKDTKKTTNTIITIIGLIAAIVTLAVYFRPRISIEPNQILNSSNPLTTTFRISNNGNLNLNNIKFMVETQISLTQVR